MPTKKKKRVSEIEESEDMFGSQRRGKLRRTTTEVGEDVLKDDSVFGQLVSKAGYILKKCDQPNMLKCDQAVFQRDLRRALKSHSVYRLPEVAHKFVEGLEKHLDHPLRLKWALLYTQTVGECVTARGAQQDSLVRLCLNVEELQAPLITLLTERLLQVAHDDQSSSSEANIPNLILANLKWLDHIVDPDTLTASIIDIIQGSPLKVQQEVINFVPDIVDDNNHPRVAEVLCNLYHSCPELTTAVLDTLVHLTLPEDTLEEVHHSVLKTLQAARPKQLPVVSRFLLNVTQQQTAYQVISDMREKINLPGDCGGSSRSPRKTQTSSSSVGEDADYEVLLFNSIKMATLSHKYLTTAWLKAIQDVGDVGSVRALDLLLLLLLHDAVPSQRHPIESIIRNKIRAGLLSDSMLGRIFTSHTTVLRENFEPLKRIAGLLLRSPEPRVSQTGTTLYRLSFLHLGKYSRQEVVLGLLRHLGDASSARGAALSLLATLAHHHTTDIAPFTIFIKGSLDSVEDLSGGEVRRVVDVVSLLVFSSSAHAALQDELIIMVRKQLSHTDLRYKHIGVLNAAFAVKNMVKVDDGHTTVNTTTSTTSRENSALLDTSALKEAENLLHLVLSSTADHPTASALFMDEMASITLRDGLNARIQEWVCEKMTEDFQERFVLDYVADSQPPQDLPLPLAACWDLTAGDSESEQAGIILNLGPLVIKAEPTRDTATATKTRLVCLAPQFRLLRMLESRLHDGDLTNIDALLGCPVYAPPLSTWDQFDQLTQQQQHAALSCLFNTLNWFREVINAFVTQKDPELKYKVYQRLQHVMEVQDLVIRYLPHCPSYTPPLAAFHLDAAPATPTLTLLPTRKAKRGRKPGAGKGKKGSKGKESVGGVEVTQGVSQANTQLAPLIPTQPSQSQPGKKDMSDPGVKPTLDPACLRPFLRELHLDVFCLLFRKLSLDTDLPNEGLLTLPQAEFLLTDLNFKLTHVFGSGTKRTSPFASDKSVGCSHLALFTPGEVAQRAHQFLKPICVHLEQISTFFQMMIADNDGVLDAANMFSEKTLPLITLNSHLFNTLSLFLSWAGLQQDENKDTLIAILRTVAKKLEGGEAVKAMGLEELTWAVCRYLSNFQPSVVSLATVATLATTLTALAALPHQQDLSQSVVEVIEAVLKREWYATGGERDRGSTYNHHVLTLLQEYLRQSKDPLSCLETFCNVAVEEFLEATGRDPASDTFPTLSKGTLSIYYRVILSFLVSGTKKSLSTLSSSPEDKYKRLLVWNSAIKILHTAVMILKKHNSRQLLTSCLKYGRMFLEVFLRCGMPLLDSCLRAHNQDVVILLKSLQGSTRLLQHVCTHSKVTQDMSLTPYVPPLKKCLEMLVYRVKAMLAINNCTNAFWMGTLKNRDLQGEEILSQSMREEAEEEEGNEEEEEEEEEVNDGQSDVELEEEEEEEQRRRSSGKEDEDKSTDYSSSF